MYNRISYYNKNIHLLSSRAEVLVKNKWKAHITAQVVSFPFFS